MTTTLANQLPRINLANGGSMPADRGFFVAPVSCPLASEVGNPYGGRDAHRTPAGTAALRTATTRSPRHVDKRLVTKLQVVRLRQRALRGRFSETQTCAHPTRDSYSFAQLRSQRCCTLDLAQIFKPPMSRLLLTQLRERSTSHDCSARELSLPLTTRLVGRLVLTVRSSTSPALSPTRLSLV